MTIIFALCFGRVFTLLYVRSRAVARPWQERRFPRAPVYRERKNWELRFAYYVVLAIVNLI